MGQGMAALFNLSLILFLIPVGILVLAVTLFLLNSPAGTPVFKWAARFFLQRQQYAYAALCFEKLYHFQLLVGDSKEYARQAGFCYEQLHQIAEAVAWFSKIEDWPKVGQLYMDSGKFDKAETIFQQRNLWTRLAYCYELQGKFAELAALYETELSNFQKAAKSYEKALAQIPTPTEQSLEWQLRLIRLNINLSRLNEARSQWQSLVEILQAQPHLATHPRIRQLGSEVKQLLQDVASS